MPKKWTKKEFRENKDELIRLYIKKNLAIREIANILNISEGGVYGRLVRTSIPICRLNKKRANNQNYKIIIPNRSALLAEFIGIMLGDGDLRSRQVAVTPGKDYLYSRYIFRIMEELFGFAPKVFLDKKDCIVVYISSVKLVRWFLKMGLVHNKVLGQVDVPRWIESKDSYKKAFIRGLVDTDGSVYKLRYGTQISICNKSLPLLQSAKEILENLNFHPSKISSYRVYLTRRKDLVRFFKEIGFSNVKHKERFLRFTGASHSGNCIWL